MMSRITAFVFPLTFVYVCGTAHATVNGKISFMPVAGVSTEIVVQDQSVNVVVTNGGKTTSEKIQVETEKSLEISLDDYNFDGVQDFSVSHVDDGMGTYTVYQIFVYSVKDGKFLPLRPRCGDEFINISTSKKKRLLINSYFVDNQMKTCAMKY